MKNIFIICPVRNCDSKVKEFIDNYVKALEKLGHKVHYNHRDVDQTDDGIGFAICEAHCDAMWNSDAVHVYWDPNSIGSHFDFGMAFAISKVRRLQFVIFNEYKTTEHKSYGNVLKELAVSGW